MRIFGAEGIIDRRIENALFKTLADAKIAPGYLGRFANGRCEQFLAGWSNFEHADIREPRVAACVAFKLAQVHQFAVPPPLDQKFDSTRSGLWTQLKEWIHALATLPIQDKQLAEKVNNFCSEYLGGSTLALLRERVDQFEKNVPPTALICFCHNDLLAFNIMYRQGGSKTGSLAPEDVQLIDFEYGCYNYRGFDLANHFCEWAGGSDDARPQYQHFPGKEAQRAFCKLYLEELINSNEPPAPEAFERSLADLAAEAEYFAPVAHVYWAVWALNQARDEGCDEFDYLCFAQHRYEESSKLLAQRTVSATSPPPDEVSSKSDDS